MTKRLVLTRDDLLFGGYNIGAGTAVHLVWRSERTAGLTVCQEAEVEVSSVRHEPRGVGIERLCPICFLILVARADVFTYRIES